MKTVFNIIFNVIVSAQDQVMDRFLLLDSKGMVTYAICNKGNPIVTNSACPSIQSVTMRTLLVTENYIQQISCNISVGWYIEGI